MISRLKLFLNIQLLLIMLIAQLCWGQQQNPFELYHRLDKVIPEAQIGDTVGQVDSPEVSAMVKSDTPTISSDSILQSYDDQENLRNALAENSISEVDSLVTKEKDLVEDVRPAERSRKDVLELPEVLQSRRNLIFSTFIILTLFLTVVISFNRAVVNKVMRSILNDNYLNLLYREQKGRWSMQFLFLYIFFIANFALLLFLIDDKWELERINANLLYLCGIIALIYFSRHFSLNLLGHTFPINKETGQFSFTIMLFNIFLGLILLPINLFIAFAPDAIADTFIYIGLSVVVLFYILRQLRGLFIGARFIMHSKFHFLLYLCTVEIAPMAVLYKFFQPFFI